MRTVGAVRIVRGPDRGRVEPILEPVTVGVSGDVCLSDQSLARMHLELAPGHDSMIVRDMGSRVGTYVSGERLPPGQPVELERGSTVVCGDTTLLVGALVTAPSDGSGPQVVVADGGALRRRSADLPVVIGRDPGQVDLVVEDTKVSRVHLEVRPSTSGWEVEDLGSSNGSYLNGDAFSQETRPLGPQDVVRIGKDVHIRVVAGDDLDGASSVSLQVAIEGRPGWHPVQVEARAGATVGDVAAALHRHVVGVVPDTMSLYRLHDGLMAAPSASWRDIGARTGQRWVVAGGITADDLDEALARDLDLGRTGAPAPVALPPRREHRAEPLAVSIPALPSEHRRDGALWAMVGGLGGVLTAAALIVLRDDTQSRVFAVIIGLTALVTAFASRMAERARRRGALRSFDEAVERLDHELRTGVEAQAAALAHDHPQAAELAVWDRDVDRLWERRPRDADFLELRVGTGDVAAALDTGDMDERGAPEARQRVRAILDEHRTMPGAPVTARVGAGDLIVAAGPRDTVAGIGRSVLVQAAVLHSPSNLTIAVLAATDEWAWTTWLPHTSFGDRRLVATSDRDASDLARVLSDTLNDRRLSNELLLVVDGEPDGAAGVIEAVTRAGGRTVLLADSPERTSREISQLLDARDDPPTWRHSRIETLDDLDVLDRASAEQVASWLAPCVEARARGTTRTAGSDDPLELLGVADPTSLDVARRWVGQGLRGVVVGLGDDEHPLTMDLRRDGPHALVAGTPGSGKSEFIKTLLIALALDHSPHALNFFLIDFKGGATFREIEALPHVVGAVTDLESDASLASRAFTALDAEVRRRKQVLDDAGVPDLVTYERGAGDLEPLPTLVVLIDEFALLNRSYPELTSMLDTVAAQGRSLGVHLVLASQDPTRAISHEIQTNTNLRVCFRVVSPALSNELLGTDDAARIPGSARGRAFVRRGGEARIDGFQGAYLSGRTRRGDATPVSVRPLWQRPTSVAAASGDSGPTDAELLCERIGDHADEEGLRAPRALWLPPLPELLPGEDLDWPQRPHDRPAAILGVADDPARQRQDVVGIDLSASGHAVVLGMFGSGKTTLLRQVVTDMTAHHPPDELHVYGVDAGDGSLAPLERLPHVASVIPAHDVELVAKLLRRLSQLAAQRRQLLSEYRGGTFSRLREERDDLPWVVLVVDDHTMLGETLDDASGTMASMYQAVVRSGPSVGLHVVSTVTQPSDMPRSLMALFGTRVLLRLADRTDYSLVERSMPRVPNWPPGRCVVSGLEASELQIAWPRDVSAPTGEPELTGPRPVRRMPRMVSLDQLEAGSDGAGIPLGVAGDDLEPAILDLGSDTPHLLVLGERGTGRSTALRTLVEGSLKHCPGVDVVTVNLFAPPHDQRVVALDDISDLEAQLTMERQTAGCLVVIDDFEQLSGELGGRVHTAIRDASRSGVRTIIAGRATDLLRSYDETVRHLVSLRTALLLAPSTDTELAFDLRPTRPARQWPPGRGLLVRRGRTEQVQVAMT